MLRTDSSGYRPSVEMHEPSGEESGLHGLPRGRHGLPRELVEENQRARLIRGMIEAIAEHGYGKTTIAHVTVAAKISRRTYYENFSNKEDCFGAAYEVTLDYLRETMLAAAAAEQRWPERVRAGLGALLQSLAAHPDLAAVVLIAPASAGDSIAARHHLAMRELVAALIAGPPAPPDSGGEPSDTQAEALAGGLSRLIVRKVSAGESEQLPELLPGLVELVLRPFIGSEEAVRVARG
jgi:AcrR family transcriptional regulator